MRHKFHLYKAFIKPNLESQIQAEEPSSELIIESPEVVPKEEKKKKKKKKTATDIHLKIKKILEKECDYKSHLKARSVLDKAFIDGYKGKRLEKWCAYFSEYEEQLVLVLGDDMGSSMRSAYGKSETKNKNKKEESSALHTDNDVSIMPEPKKENEEEMIDLPDLPLDDLEEIEVVDTSLEDESGGAVVFGIVGAGQAGGRLAESFYKLGYKKAIAVNTAEHDLNGLADLPEPQKIVMTSDSAGGAGKDMRKGEAAADKHQQEIYEKMQKLFGKVERILVCAGSGGGTGGGSCLRLVETAKKYLQYIGVSDVNHKVGVLLTLPTSGESASPTVAKNAHLLSTKLCDLADEGEVSPLIIFDNDKIKKMYPRLTVRQFWPTVNATVTGLFHMFNVLSAQSSDLTSFDPADYTRVLSAGGCMIMGMTPLKSYQDGTDVSRAIRGNIEKGLLCGGFDISTAGAAACIATAPGVVLDSTPGLMDSLETGFDTLAQLTGNATVFRGIYEVRKEKVVVYTMLTGLKRPAKRLAELEKTESNNVVKSKLFE